MPFVSAADQLAMLRRGVDAITPEPDFAEKLEKLGCRRHAPPRQVRDRPDRDRRPPRPHRPASEAPPVSGSRAIPLSIIIGNYTALVGDPSGRDEARASLTEEQVEANARDYLVQVGKIIDLSRAEVHRNGEWFSKWTFLDVLDLTRKMTLGQISAREDFAKRIGEKRPVYLHECLYPLMQGWDSVEVRSDVELGGTEQLFSLLVARDLQQGRGLPGQVAITMPILVGTDGVRKMGKSLANYIGVAENPEDQFGKVMSLPDGPMRQYFTLLTDLPLAEVDALLAEGSTPATRRRFSARRSSPSTTAPGRPRGRPRRSGGGRRSSTRT